MRRVVLKEEKEKKLGGASCGVGRCSRVCGYVGMWESLLEEVNGERR
jgi:hypothetical protein